METQAFVYKWTHIPTMKWYIGSRTAKGCHHNDGYICSSKVVKPMIQEVKEDWKREIIATGEPKNMLNFEALILKTLDAKNDINSFNLHNGDGNFTMLGQVGAMKGCTPWNKGLTKETDNRVAKYSVVTENKKGHTPWNKGLSVRLNPAGEFKIGNIPWNKGLGSEHQPWFNKNHSAETKKILSEQKMGIKNPMYGNTPWNKGIKTGRKWFNNGKTSKLFVPGTEPVGFILGRIMNTKWFNNGKEAKQFIPGTEPEGFVLGRLKNTKHYYNNGTLDKLFNESEVPKGFVLGRIDKTSWFTNGTDNIKCLLGNEPKGFYNGRTLNNVKYYNNGKKMIRVTLGTEPKGFVLGMLPRGKWFNNRYESKRFIPGTEPNDFVLGRLIQKYLY